MRALIHTPEINYSGWYVYINERGCDDKGTAPFEKPVTFCALGAITLWKLKQRQQLSLSQYGVIASVNKK
jgi:hypothetical protein